MQSEFGIKDILKWTEVISDPENLVIPHIKSKLKTYREIFTVRIAEYLYNDVLRTGLLVDYPLDFQILTDKQRSVWLDYAAGIPFKLKSLGLLIRPYKDFFRTCIITEDEIEKLTGMDYKNYGGEKNESSFSKKFYRELNYMIPVQIIKTGFEIIRNAEDFRIDAFTLKKLAKAIHARYLQEMRDKSNPDEYEEGKNNQFLTDFDSLPDDIKFSNKDNALHIPTKLLSIGYIIRPIKEGYRSFTLHLNEEEIDNMAWIEHLRWSWDKRLNGWIYGNIKDINKKTHPGLIPYDKLSEVEKEKDRQLVRLIPALLQDIGYTACPVSPEKIMDLSYAIKPHSSLHKLLTEIKKLNEEISKASSGEMIEEKVRITNKKIEETISEVEGNYNYAQHIQKTYLPDDLFVRECFPESFILFIPKDIVSGDFYFFSKNAGTIIFAVADCTGHGIPGALLSTLGYEITDQAVNEVKLTDPAAIMIHLYSKVHKFLRRDEEGLSDDMDIAVCNLNTNTRVLNYCGVKNPLIRITNGELLEYRPENSADEWFDSGKFHFKSKMIQLSKGDALYLFSDGYTDQFGGMHHKKYQSSKFKTFLMSISGLSMLEQKDRLYEETEQWREENDEDQTDDILVIGLRI